MPYKKRILLNMKRHNKFIEMMILSALMIIIAIVGFYLYTSYTDYTSEKKLSAESIAILSNSNGDYFPTDTVEGDQLQKVKINLDDKAEKIIFNMMEQHKDYRIKTEERMMIILALVLILSLLFVLIIRNIFSKMAHEDKNLQNILRHLENYPNMKKKYKIKEMSLKQDKIKIYQFLKKIIDDLEESTNLSKKANQAKSLFLANMSHEIRTPLNGIVGFTDLLRTSDLNLEQDEYVEIIQKSSENLLLIINDILDISKIESEKIEIEQIEFNPILEFESGIESYGAKASEKKIDLGFFIDPTLSHKLIGDPSKIIQVLVNLISNAVKFTPTGGNIDIRIEKIVSFEGKSTVKFLVKDSGIGITPEQKSKIFEAFSQADSSTSRTYGGTGLGLTISKKLIELMGGELDLESKKGEGSTFFFTLQFEEVPSETTNQTIENLSVGYYLPHHKKTKQSDEYIKQYLTSLSPNYTIYDTIESLEQSEQPEILFIDFEYIDNADILRLNALHSKICLLANLHQKDEIKTLSVNFYKTLYAPINFTKIRKSLFNIKNKETRKDVLETGKNKFFNIKALVAEDNLINQKLIKLTLEYFGVSVTIANNGKEAYEQRCAEEFDLIFMDYQMPVMNGIESTHAILTYEKEKEIAHIPIVALTANALKGDKEHFLAEGMDNYISKPIKKEEIKNILNLYFPNKFIEDPVKMMSDKEHVDILLCKKEKGNSLIFNTLLKKLGYSVDSIRNTKELKQMIQSKQYNYVLLDKSLENLSEDNEISEIMDKFAIKSILLVDNTSMIRDEDYKNYSRVALNVPNLRFLEHIIKSA